MPINYEVLRVIWWILLGVLLIGFVIMDGFDLGVGILLHRVARTNDERRVVLNTVGPVWEGNQIWLILGAGAIFAAWPELYAVSFSGFYFAMLVILFGLILRPVGFKYRSKVNNKTWRKVWDAGIFIAGFVPAICFGVAVGNVLQGVPFHFDSSMRDFYTGSFFALLNPFALLCGLLSAAMMTMHGGTFLGIKTEGAIQKRATYYAQLSALLVIILFVIAGFWIAYGLEGYVLTSQLAHDGPSNPLFKTVTQSTGAWFNNYHQYHALILVPVIGIASTLIVMPLLNSQFFKTAWFFSSLAIFCIISTVGVSMFPFMLPSSTHPDMSLLVWDSSASQTTLFVMLISALFFVPIILMYTSWVYYVLRGKVTTHYIQKNQSNMY